MWSDVERSDVVERIWSATGAGRGGRESKGPRATGACMNENLLVTFFPIFILHTHLHTHKTKNKKKSSIQHPRRDEILFPLFLDSFIP